MIPDLFDEEKRFPKVKRKPTWLKHELKRLLPVLPVESNYSITDLEDGRLSVRLDIQKQSALLCKPKVVVTKRSKSAPEAKKSSLVDAELDRLSRPRSASPRPVFKKELVSGSIQLPSKGEELRFSSGKSFRKRLQPIYPELETGNDSLGRKEKGHRRWIDDPDYIEPPTEMANRPFIVVEESSEEEEGPVTSESELVTDKGSITSDLISPSLSPRQGTLSEVEFQESKSLRAQMAADWRNRWRFTVADTADPNELLELLSDLHPFTRIRGIVTITYIAHGQHSVCSDVPTYLLRAVETMVLEDTDVNVRKAGAICLSSLNIFSDDIKQILIGIIRNEHGDSVNKWSAAQGLVHNQVYTSDVIQILIRIYVDNYSPDGTDDPRRETTLKLIRIISSGTALAPGMMGELLVNSDWEIRVSACDMLSVCHGPLPGDIVSKLSQLMWNDWCDTVRTAASKALGKTGHGLEVHHQLTLRLKSKNGSDRTRALQLISLVGFMTVRLMPPFLECFRDSYTDVRQAACAVAARLYKQSIKEGSLLDFEIANRLVEIIQFDTASAVRIYATDGLVQCLKALDAIDPRNPQSSKTVTIFKTEPSANDKLREKIHGCFLWALQTASEDVIRITSIIVLREQG